MDEVESTRAGTADRGGTDGPGEFTETEWVQLCRQFGNACALCGRDEALVPDLVVPARLGGTRAIRNIQPLCARCRRAKGRHLVDYRPFVSRRAGSSETRKRRSNISRTANGEKGTVAKMITQRHLLAIEHRHDRVQYGAVEDPILEQDVALLLIEEIKRLRALVVSNMPLARVETIAWQERYADLLAREAKKRMSEHLDAIFRGAPR